MESWGIWCFLGTFLFIGRVLHFIRQAFHFFNKVFSFSLDEFTFLCCKYSSPSISSSFFLCLFVNKLTIFVTNSFFYFYCWLVNNFVHLIKPVCNFLLPSYNSVCHFYVMQLTNYTKKLFRRSGFFLQTIIDKQIYLGKLEM